MYLNVYERKVDRQRRIAMPPDWNYAEVMVFEGENELKIVPKSREKLLKMIDSIPVRQLGSPYKEFRKKLTLEKYGGKR